MKARGRVATQLQSHWPVKTEYGYFERGRRFWAVRNTSTRKKKQQQMQETCKRECPSKENGG